ncbi:MAG: hypothetical protein IKR22_00660, partial [Clostridiales bacterium]|nr:hypothetical protein [Clostridiales bacterium]
QANADLENSRKEKERVDAETAQLLGSARQEKEKMEKEASQMLEQAKKTVADAEAEKNKLTSEARASCDVIAKQKAALESDIAKMTKEQEQSKHTFETQIAGLQTDLDNAKAIIADSKIAKKLAEVEAQELILKAEKRAVALKDAALSESEKGKLQDELKKKESELAEMAKSKEELEKQLNEMQKTIKKMQDRIDNMPVGGGAVAIADGMKEYSVVVVPHLSNGEVNSERIAEILATKAAGGWRLHSIVNDEGGKLQATIGGGDSVSLNASSVSIKEDRVIMIFERNIEEE